MIVGHDKQWKDEGQDISAPWLKVYKLPMKSLTSFTGRYKPELMLRYSIDNTVKHEYGIFDSETFIDLGLSGRLLTIDNLFPLSLLEEYRREFLIVYENRKLDGKSVKSFQGRYYGDPNGRELNDGFVVIDGHSLWGHSRLVSQGYERSNSLYKIGLRKIKRNFDSCEKLVYNVPGVSNEGKEVMKLLSKKFNEEFNYLLSK